MTTPVPLLAVPVTRLGSVTRLIGSVLIAFRPTVVDPTPGVVAANAGWDMPKAAAEAPVSSAIRVMLDIVFPL